MPRWRIRSPGSRTCSWARSTAGRNRPRPDRPPAPTESGTEDDPAIHHDPSGLLEAHPVRPAGDVGGRFDGIVGAEGIEHVDVADLAGEPDDDLTVGTGEALGPRRPDPLALVGHRLTRLLHRRGKRDRPPLLVVHATHFGT